MFLAHFVICTPLMYLRKSSTNSFSVGRISGWLSGSLTFLVFKVNFSIILIMETVGLF